MKGVKSFVKECVEKCKPDFEIIDDVALTNSKRVLSAFINNRVALRHFAGTTGYGYDDIGRDTLNMLFAEVFQAESAVVSPSIASGTHAIALALYGVLRPGDVMLSVSGDPYDTLSYVIGGSGIGGLADYNVTFEKIPLTSDGGFDFQAISDYFSQKTPKMVYVQRSRGYEWRSAISVRQIEKLCKFIRNLKGGSDVCIMVDNCYGEFVEEVEPTGVGADLCAGSLIKNPGGGIAPTGGYIAGKKMYVEMAANRLTVPSIGTEVGSYERGYREFYQGLFLAPHTVAQALKTATLFCKAFSALGYDTKPRSGEKFYDIVCSIKIGDPDKLIEFCRSIQQTSPVDGYVSPEPWDMPGYSDQVIMAAGCFVQGSSVELSCDSPIKPPYIAYLQGGLTFEHGVIALENVLKNLK